jgi:low density lipoprotein-related protein 2
MYDAMGSMESQVEAAAASGSYVIPSGDSSTGSSSAGGSPASTLAAGGTFMEPPSAILAPSSVTHKSSPQLAVRHKELAPSTVDTGKDTQCLVTEDDSEC